jgi:hypothetical protein
MRSQEAKASESHVEFNFQILLAFIIQWYAFVETDHVILIECETVTSVSIEK